MPAIITLRERGEPLRLISNRLAWFSVVAIVAATVGCKAQDAGAKDPMNDPALRRRIEVLVRSQFSVPPEYDFTMGERKPGAVPGYDSLSVTLSRGARTNSFDFLISTDNKSLARLQTFDLAQIPSQNIAVDSRPIRGNPAAKVTVINYDDLECPYCARMHQSLFPDTLERYKDKVRFIYKDDPLVEIHPWAMHAAVDSNCIGDQNQKAYWGYVDYLHAHGQDVTGEDRNLQKSFGVLDKIAREQGKIFNLDATRLDACLQKQDEATVRTSMKEAESLGVDGTPSLFIEGEHLYGAVPSEQVWMVIDRALRAAGVEPPPPPTPATQPVSTPPLGQ